MKKSREEKETKMIHLHIQRGGFIQSKANSIANNLPEFGNLTGGLPVLFPLPLITKK